MPRFSPYYHWFRNEIWALIEDCRSCEQAECPSWCNEFVELQMDELLDKVIKGVRGEDSDAFERGGSEPTRLGPANIASG